ncbi:MAG: hypothetical protein WHS89_02020 [Acidimicrobiales bacterium]
MAVCRVDDSVLYDVPSGLVLNDRVSTSRLLMKLSKQGGFWKVEELGREQKWDGAVEC